MPPQLLSGITKRACAYHLTDTGGKLYDSDGNECVNLSKDDKIFLAIALSICGLVLAILGGIYMRKIYRSRAKERAAQLAYEPKTSSMGTPLMRHAGSFASLPLSRQTSNVPVPVSPLLSSDSSHSTSSSTNPGSPYSPNSENFHFPILSADGHLLPPPPASSRRSPIELIDPNARPLPLAPTSPNAPLYAPVPKSTERWSYRTPSEDSHANLYPSGLYSGVEIRRDGSVEIMRDDFGIETANMRSSPTISRVDHSLNGYAPQRATFYRSLSAEGDDLSVYDYVSEEQHGRY
ncbi:uncharacterized protein I206_107187 [Kwoniella pini CBS 10737]|uniref:Uncharacterized protein n=1 Tax=Kwoniella pini CBS 10737 TaxID=1296096 RepID=A0A1B9HZ25_9TREE|nr:uncharacterized protein I206_05267 [Kwoniella pini CBS 10737]OCF48488.1 hypothetical protein I206_05267 [Kwoniella pini CBS 10737]